MDEEDDDKILPFICNKCNTICVINVTLLRTSFLHLSSVLFNSPNYKDFDEHYTSGINIASNYPEMF